MASKKKKKEECWEEGRVEVKRERESEKAKQARRKEEGRRQTKGGGVLVKKGEAQVGLG
jgi:hypothetical protein